MNKVSSLNLPFPIKFTLNWRLLFKVVLLAIFALLSFYLIQIEEVIRMSYLNKVYQQEIQEISQATAFLKAQAQNVTTLENVEEEIKNLSFEEVREIKYIPISSEYLVKEIR